MSELTMEELVMGIAKHLDGWDATPNGEVAFLTHAESGAGLVLSFMWPTDRIEIRPFYTHADQGGVRRIGNEITITAAVKRGAEAIAKDIQRKLVAHVVEMQRNLIEFAHKRQAILDREVEVLGNLVAPVGGRVFDGRKCSTKTQGSFEVVNGLTEGSVQLHSGATHGSLNLLYAPVDLLTRIIAVCAQYETEQSN
jgi:hypothetical protein